MRSLEHPHILRFLDLLDRAQAILLGRDRGQVGSDRKLEVFYETVWKDAARELGASVERLGQGVLQVRRGGMVTRVLANSTALDDQATHCVVRTKPVVYGLLARRGLPVPRHLTFNLHEIDRAAQFLTQAGRPCVVKPASDTGGGQGVTTGIRDRRQLARAAWAAARGGRSVLIEEQIAGDNIRLLFLDGRLLDAVKREPPMQVADGHSTVGAMIKAANAKRSRDGEHVSHACISFNMDLDQTLAGQGLTLRSVPPRGTRIRLKTVINENAGEENRSVTDEIGTELIEEAAEAVRATGVRLAGVDVITTDMGSSLRRSGGVILEVNSPPGYFWHYRKADGAFPVAVHALRALLEPTIVAARPAAGAPA